MWMFFFLPTSTNIDAEKEFCFLDTKHVFEQIQTADIYEEPNK